MDWTERQTPIDISGTVFPDFVDDRGVKTGRFWFVKEEFVKHSRDLLTEGRAFSSISSRLVDNRWVCDGQAISISKIASFVMKMRLFYMKSENMSIYSFCDYMERSVANLSVRMFFKHMRTSWEEYLMQDAIFSRNYSGSIRTNKQLIDTVLYSGNFHSQEKYKKRYDELLGFMDEGLILMHAYNAMHSGYQMNQIGRAVGELREENLVILLPDHLRHEWDENCPYAIIK